jgi:hypothetical protein
MTLEEEKIEEVKIAARIILREYREAREAEEESEESEEAELDPEPPEEPREYLVVQRRYFEAARQRAINALPHPGTFGNPKDYETHVQIRIAQEAGIAFCNTKDSLGGQLGNTVEEVAERCVKAEAGSKKQKELIADLQDQLEEANRRLGQSKGGQR